ncbi:MAG: homoserine dehydrogenase [Pseudomonadota bacterium]
MNNPLKLGIAGLGTVGTGLLHIFQKNSEKINLASGRPIKVAAVSARNRNKDRGLALSHYEWFDDPVKMAEDPSIDVFVELIGGEEGVARSSVEAALNAKKHVVTANKALLAVHGVALSGLAEKNDVALNFEAAIAGGIPVVKTMRESLQGNTITRVYGILNGTCNYILTKMEREGQAYDEALKDAQDAGFAEVDPTFDVGGFDAAHKLSLLTSLAFGTEISFENIYIEGISSISPIDIEVATDLGYRIKLLGVAVQTEDGIEQRVHPTMVPFGSAIAEVNGVTNCVNIEGNFVGDVTLVGAGAGAGPTASSVMADIIDVARGVIFPPFVVPTNQLVAYKRARMRQHEGRYYIRLSVYDRPGAFAAIANRMAEQEISLESIVQRGSEVGQVHQGNQNTPQSSFESPIPVILITHKTCENFIRKALEGIEADGNIASRPQMIRIENL